MVRLSAGVFAAGRTLAKDLRLGERRCDAIAVTGTGILTPAGKVAEFREVLGDFPPVIGAGVTRITAQNTFAVRDGTTVSS